jgi:ankyrin repeat protein
MDIPGVTGLYLDGLGIGHAGAARLGEVLQRFPGLKTLNLRENHFGEAGAQTLAQVLPTFTILESLDVSRNNLGANGARHLVPAINSLKNLKLRNIGNNGLTIDETVALARELKHIPLITASVPYGLPVKDDHRAVIQEILAAHGQVDERDPDTGKTSLMFAVGRNDQQLFDLLLAHGANPRARNGLRDVASYAGSEGARWLAVHLMDPSVLMVWYDKDDAISYFSSQALAAMRHIIESGVSPDKRDPSSGKTPLMVAVQKGYEELVELLVEKGADPRAINSKDGGRDVASYATWHTPPRVAVILKDPNVLLAPYDRGSTYFSDDGVAAMKSLIEAGVSPDHRNPITGMTPLMVAARWGYYSLIDLLVEKGADPYATNPKDGNRDVMSYARRDRGNIVQTLTDYMNRTPRPQ